MGLYYETDLTAFACWWKSLGSYAGAVAELRISARRSLTANDACGGGYHIEVTHHVLLNVPELGFKVDVKSSAAPDHMDVEDELNGIAARGGRILRSSLPESGLVSIEHGRFNDPHDYAVLADDVPKLIRGGECILDDDPFDIIFGETIEAIDPNWIWCGHDWYVGSGTKSPPFCDFLIELS